MCSVIESALSTEALDVVVYSKYADTSDATWGCHDPKLFQDDDGTYYVYSTGWNNGVDLRTSTDLHNWTAKTYPLEGNWDDDFLRWLAFTPNSGKPVTGTVFGMDRGNGNGNTYSSSSVDTGSWAPTVTKLNGKYYMFHGIIVDTIQKAAAITLAIADNPKGPFIPASKYDPATYKTSTLVRFCNEPKDVVMHYDDGSGSFTVPYSQCLNNWYYAANGQSNDNTPTRLTTNSTYYGFGAIDPEFVIDVADGSMKEFTIGSRTCYAMIYGSWRCGIALIYVDAATLKPVASVAGTSTTGKIYAVGDIMDEPLDTLEGNFGIPLVGGVQAGYEGAQLIYNSNTGYYYMFVSMGNLMYEYRVGMGRSTSITGPYYDTNGFGMDNHPSDTHFYYHRIGAKIFGAMAFNGEYGWRCPGGLSVWRDIKTGAVLLAAHSRTNYRGEGDFALQVHQLFFNEKGWPVMNANEYYDENLEPLTMADIAGTYDVIRTTLGTGTESFTAYSGAVTNGINTADAHEDTSVAVTIAENGTISGNYTGTFTLGADGYSATIVAGGSTYYGYVFNARKGYTTRKTISFTVLESKGTFKSNWATENQYLFGNKRAEEVESSTNATPASRIEKFPTEDTSCEISSSITIGTLGSVVANADGLSVSFKLNGGYSSDWSDVLITAQTKIRLSTIDYLPDGTWADNVMEAASAENAVTGNPYAAYYNSACFVTISFNADGSIVFYKNGLPVVTYSGTTQTTNRKTTVAAINKLFISDLAQTGFTIAAGSYTYTGFIIDTAVDAAGAAKLYASYGSSN